MHGDPVTQWAFTLVFGALGIVSLVWLASDRRRPLQVVGNLLHLLMAVAMVWMAWSVPSTGAIVTQLVVFAAGTVWFAVMAVLRATGRVRRRAVGDHGPWQLLGHAVMMAAMVWMIAAMGASGAEHTNGGHGHHHAEVSVFPVLLGVAATAALVVTGVLLVVELVDCVRSSRGLRRHTGDLAGGAAMSLGMAAMCWAVLG